MWGNHHFCHLFTISYYKENILHIVLAHTITTTYTLAWRRLKPQQILQLLLEVIYYSLSILLAPTRRNLLLTHWRLWPWTPFWTIFQNFHTWSTYLNQPSKHIGHLSSIFKLDPHPKYTQYQGTKHWSSSKYEYQYINHWKNEYQLHLYNHITNNTKPQLNQPC